MHNINTPDIQGVKLFEINGHRLHRIVTDAGDRSYSEDLQIFEHPGQGVDVVIRHEGASIQIQLQQVLESHRGFPFPLHGVKKLVLASIPRLGSGLEVSSEPPAHAAQHLLHLGRGRY